MKSRNIQDKRMSIVTFLKSTYFLTSGLAFIGGMILIVGAIILRIVYGPQSSDVFIHLLIIISCGFMLTGSIFIIIRKEIVRDPKGILPSIKGRWAVILGTFATLVSGFAEIGLLYFFLLDLFGK